MSDSMEGLADHRHGVGSASAARRPSSGAGRVPTCCHRRLAVTRPRMQSLAWQCNVHSISAGLTLAVRQDRRWPGAERSIGCDGLSPGRGGDFITGLGSAPGARRYPVVWPCSRMRSIRARSRAGICRRPAK